MPINNVLLGVTSSARNPVGTGLTAPIRAVRTPDSDGKKGRVVEGKEPQINAELRGYVVVGFCPDGLGN